VDRAGIDFFEIGINDVILFSLFFQSFCRAHELW